MDIEKELENYLLNVSEEMLAYNTVVNYKCRIKAFLKYFNHKSNPNEITLDEFEKYLNLEVSSNTKLCNVNAVRSFYLLTNRNSIDFGGFNKTPRKKQARLLSERKSLLKYVSNKLDIDVSSIELIDQNGMIIKASDFEETELWKQLYEFKDYQVSNFGRIKSIGRQISIGVRNGIEYFRYKPQHFKVFRTNGIEPFLFTTIEVRDKKGVKKSKTIYPHRAVADHFCHKPKYIRELEKNGHAVYASHIIKDYTNNRYDNVRFISHKDLMRSQPNRLKDPTKSWRTRREKYKNKWGSLEEPKWNPNPQKRLATIRENRLKNE